MKREDFDGATFQNTYEIGSPKVKIDDFTFDKNRVSNSPFLMLMLLIVIDPNEKQKEVLDKFGVVFTDDFGKQIYPKEDKKEGNINDQR